LPMRLKAQDDMMRGMQGWSKGALLIRRLYVLTWIRRGVVFSLVYLLLSRSDIYIISLA
jgi:hypothetical protein